MLEVTNKDESVVKLGRKYHISPTLYLTERRTRSRCSQGCSRHWYLFSAPRKNIRLSHYPYLRKPCCSGLDHEEQRLSIPTHTKGIDAAGGKVCKEVGMTGQVLQ